MKQEKLIFLLTLSQLMYIYAALSGHAQTGFPNPPDARSLGIGMVSATLDGISGASLNGAILALSETTGVQCHASQPYGLPELRELSISGAVSHGPAGTIFGAIRHTGFESYHEFKFSLGYSRKVLSRTAISARFNLSQVRIAEYGSTLAPGFDLDLYVQPTDQISVGIILQNPVPVGNRTRLHIPSAMRGGIAYTPGKTVTIYGEVEKPLNRPVSVKAGLEYTPVAAFSFRAGVRTIPSTAHFGIGVQVRQVYGVDLGLSYDFQLGLTPGISLSYLPQKRKP